MSSLSSTEMNRLSSGSSETSTWVKVMEGTSSSKILIVKSQLVSTFWVLGSCQVVGACQVFATNLVVSTQVSPNQGKVGWGG